MTQADALAIHTIDEAAAILRVKPSWLERQAAARKVPFTMLGGSYRFTTAHLAAIVQLHEQIPQPASRAAERERSTRPRRESAPGPGLAGTLMQPLRPRPYAARQRAA